MAHICFLIFLILIHYSAAAMNKGLHGMYTNFDYLPSDTRFADQGTAPVFDTDSTAVRETLDKLFPIIRKIGPRPAPSAHSSDLSPMSRVDVSPADNDAELSTKFFNDLLANYSSFKYIPMRHIITTSGKTTQFPVSVDACQLARWNFELPLTRIPNAILQIVADKTQWPKDLNQQKNTMAQLLNALLLGIGSHYARAKEDYSYYDFFTLSGQDPSGSAVNSAECDSALEYSYRMSVQALLYVYNLTVTAPVYLESLVNAAGGCLIQPDKTTLGDYPPTERLPCLDYAFDAAQLLRLTNSFSVFGANELCSSRLTPPLSTCLTGSAAYDGCGGDSLVALSIFARSFYLCSRIFPRQALDDLVTARSNRTGSA
ncbi:uncharacterized protein LOC129599239 [Paramacrobiotus metropolitanus]|uniref:uncharacterized protein LOC129599239 n=1 Tax=Paramacrobiotus metropolitanus TaxID=2943436 RepID=UPI002445C974|nr:uncharacterized protein LOC129599239 [Paramacrobiotus metropolitanus]